MAEIKFVPMPLKMSDLDSAIRLMGFDYGDALYHVLCFNFGDDGGAIGIWREGSTFCARVSLNDLALFWMQAAIDHPAVAHG